MRWHCVAKPHTAPVVLEREEKFIEHMKREHPGKFRDDQLPLIAESSSHPKDPTFDDCPFCPESPANLEDHIGQHLCDLALRSLPWPDDEQSSRQESCLDNESWSSDEGTRDTTNKFRSELPEPDFDDDSEAGDGSKPKEGERLHSYGYLEDIAHQHKPLDLPDLLNDKALTILAQHQHSEYITTMGIQVSVNNSARAHLGFRVSPEDKNIKEELDEDKGEFFGSSTPSLTPQPWESLDDKSGIVQYVDFMSILLMSAQFYARLLIPVNIASFQTIRLCLPSSKPSRLSILASLKYSIFRILLDVLYIAELNTRKSTHPTISQLLA
jgi:hypothetical protein